MTQTNVRHPGDWRGTVRIGLAGALAAALLTLAVAAPPATATFPGRNGEIVFRQWGSGKDVFTATSLMSFDWRKTAERTLDRCYVHHAFAASEGCMIYGVSVSRNGRKVVYPIVQFRDFYAGEVERSWVVVATASGDRRRMIEMDRPLVDPVWSPKGSAFIGTQSSGPGLPASGDENLVLVQRRTGTARALTTEGGSGADWAANGHIAYVDDGEVWLTRIGQGVRRLTHGGGKSPSWAPSGRRLAFERNDQIWTIRADGTRPRLIRRTGATEPVWSPNGRWILFLQAERPHGLSVRSLYVMRPNGRGARPLPLSFRGDDYYAAEGAAWQSLRRMRRPCRRTTHPKRCRARRSAR